MIRRDVLYACLVFVVAVWSVLSLMIVIGRARYDRRTRRERRLRELLPRTARADASGRIDVRSIARELTDVEFRNMALAGLPRAVEISMALELRARAEQRRRGRRVSGTRRANVWRRVTTLQLLVSSQDPAAYVLLHHSVRSGERALAAAAIRMLIRLDNRRAADILIGALRTNAYTRSRIAAAFDRLTVPRSDMLAPLFHDDEPIVRFWGARLAGRLHASEWVAQVRQLTTDPDPRVRRAAVEAVGRIGAPDDRALLLGRLHDEAPMVRAHAARASAAFADPSVADALAGLLADREWIVRAAARETLGRIGGTGRAAVLRTLWHSDTFAANSAAEVLWLTGAVPQAGRLLYANPANRDLARMLARFLEVAGPHLPRAFFEQFSDSEAAALRRIIRQQTGSGVHL